MCIHKEKSIIQKLNIHIGFCVIEDVGLQSAAVFVDRNVS